MIRIALKLLLTGLIALLMPLLVHAEEVEETKEETKIVEKESINNTKSINQDYCIQKNLTDGTCMTNEDYIEENTRNISNLLKIGVGVLIAIFLTRRN